MKIILSLALLVVLYGQSNKPPKNGLNSTQKKIDATSGPASESITGTITGSHCISSFVYDSKTNTCSITFSIYSENNETITCNKVHKEADAYEMKCRYTPKRAKP